MPPFPQPAFTYNYQIASQINSLRDYRNNEPGRQIPVKAANRLLIATWNIANLGVQQRRRKDHRLLAEMISWFDLVAVQEVSDNLAGLRGIHSELPGSYRLLFSDVSGNNERLAFIYDSSKVTLLEKVGEVAIPPSAHRYITRPGNWAEIQWVRSESLFGRLPGRDIPVPSGLCTHLLRQQ